MRCLTRSIQFLLPVNWMRSVFFTLVAAVVGVLIYPLALGAVMPRVGLVAPPLVTLIAGFVVGLLSGSWRIAVVCSWFTSLVGVAGLLIELVALPACAVCVSGGMGPTATGLDVALSLALGGLSGAFVGGWLGANMERWVR